MVCMSVIVWPRHHAPNFVILISYFCAQIFPQEADVWVLLVWCMQNDPQDPFVTHNARIVRFVILSQTLVLGDPVCTKQVPGQYRELVLIMWTAFIPRLTNSSRGSFAHLLHWRRCKRYISKTVFFQLENLCFECRCFSLAESHVYQSWVSIFVH